MVGDPRRIRSLQPVQPAVLLLTAGNPRRTHSLLPVQPVVLFTCGGRVLLTLSALRARTKARVRHVADADRHVEQRRDEPDRQRPLSGPSGAFKRP